MWIQLGNLNAKVSRATQDEIAWLRSKESGLTFTNRKTLWTTGQTELVRFFDLEESVFPAGLVGIVQKHAAACRVKIEILDTRKPPMTPVGSSGIDEGLRGYQLDAVNAAMKATRGIIKIGTGGGKSRCAAGIAMRVPDARWVFLVHRTSLVAQMADVYEALTGEKAGRIGGGVWIEQPHFTCASFQSLVAALKNKKHADFFSSIQGMLVDECHSIPAETHYRVAQALPNAYWRIGVSATPLDREDQRTAYALGTLGPIIYEHTAADLIEAGVLAAPSIRMVRVFQEFDQRDKFGCITRWPWQKI